MTIADILIIVFGVIFGAILGSFACCQACRLRIREKGGKNPGPRSICLRCRHQLKWYDNIPILSWVILRGRCRYCKKPIGLAELLSEISMAIIIILITLYYKAPLISLSTVGIASYVILVITITIFWILLLYDAEYGLLPTSLLISAVATSAIFRLLNLDYSISLWPQLISLLASIGLLAGLYYMLYLISHEKWVGSGDWLLALAIALILGNWWLALIELTVSNSLALGGILAHTTRSRSRTHSAPFGPYLIIACILIFLLQNAIMLS